MVVVCCVFSLRVFAFVRLPFRAVVFVLFGVLFVFDGCCCV